MSTLDGDRPELVLTSVTISCPDPHALAEFYARLLGVEVGAREPGWCQVRTDTLTLNLELDAAFTPITWPSTPQGQNATQHLDIRVRDLEAAVRWAERCGARQDPVQPQEGVRVMRDVAGMPFCLFLGGS